MQHEYITLCQYRLERAKEDLKAAQVNCILRSPADSDALQSGRCAGHNGRPETSIIVS